MWMTPKTNMYIPRFVDILFKCIPTIEVAEEGYEIIVTTSAGSLPPPCADNKTMLLP